MWKHHLLKACTVAAKRSARQSLTKGPAELAVVLRALNAWCSNDSKGDDIEYWTRAVCAIEWQPQGGQSDSEAPCTEQLALRRILMFAIRISMEKEYTTDSVRQDTCEKILKALITNIEFPKPETDYKKLLLEEFTESHDVTYINENIAYMHPCTSPPAARTPRHPSVGPALLPHTLTHSLTQCAATHSPTHLTQHDNI